MIPKSIDSNNFNQKFHHCFFSFRNEQTNSIFIRKGRGPKRPRIVKTTSKENEFGPFMLSYLMIYYKAALFQAMLYCYHSRQTDQWNRTKNSKIGLSTTYWHLPLALTIHLCKGKITH